MNEKRRARAPGARFARAATVMAALLLLAGGVTAQEPLVAIPASPASTYSLTWWSADAGGVSYASAGSFALGGTAGQADAAPERSGGRYILRSGFWQPSCTAAAVAPTIARAGNTITLSWVYNSANQAYQVHRGTTPYFTPADATRRALVTGAPWAYTDPDTVIGNPDVNYYYVVRARACGAASADSGGAASST